MVALNIHQASANFSIATSLPGNANVALPAYGHDLSCTTDLDPAMVEVDGLVGLSQSLFRRIITPRGTLIDDPNYGFDLTQFLNDDLGPQDVSRIGTQVDAEYLKDERVYQSSTTITIVPLSNATASGTLVVASLVTPSTGPTFRLVISVSAVTQALLQAST